MLPTPSVVRVHRSFLIHDLKPESSSYEWKRVVKALAKKHTVYTIDLLGCGYSDKPNITYTAYMYTQLLNDFIVNDNCTPCKRSCHRTVCTAYHYGSLQQSISF